MMGDCVLRISKLENGYEVEFCDPDVRKENAKPKSDYTDPWKGYAFSTVEEVSAFIDKKLGDLEPPPDADEEFSSAFSAAAKG